ncbi:MAG: exo-alpha-sialidase [Pirellulales bacterium]|nr:exo-alpha-sialidase [Pirellulales bacterium]
MFPGRLATVSAVLLTVATAHGAPWSEPLTLVDAHGRLALANQLHVVGHTGGQMVHRSSLDDGATWSAPTTISTATGNFPMQYGGLYADGDTVYLLTAAGHMGPSSQHLDFRKSNDNGVNWSSPIRITGAGQQIRRANIVVSGENVHVFGGQSGAGGYGTGLFYFRSTNGGLDWDPGKPLYANADASARLAVDGTTLHVAFGDKLAANSFGGRTAYMRSADNGATWSAPVTIGEEGRQARQQIVAADGQVFAIWQREALTQGDPLPADRLGYNRSNDGGLTWLGPALLPRDSGVNREHQQTWLTPGGGLHLSWSHGDPGNAASSNGYMYSPDYGASWFDREIAFDTASSGNLPHNIIADENWVHILAEPGAGTYVRRQVILPGDYDNNRIVDASDLAVWKSNFGIVNSATTLQGDADGDQDVDGADLLVWQRQLGRGAALASVAVPEPASWPFVIVGAVLLTRRRSDCA